jgi:membrane protease YdiL (CAAX protease family)
VSASILRDPQRTSSRTIGRRLGALLDPQRNTVAFRAAAAWLAFMAGLVIGDDVEGAAAVGVGGAIGAALVVVGFAAASRCRVLARRSNTHWLRLCGLSLAVGAGMGLVNLAANRGIAEADPVLRTLMVERMARLDPRPWEAIFAGPITEEVVFRLFVMSVIAWVATRVTKSANAAFVVALIGSAAIFAAPHLERPIPDDPMLATFYRAALMTKYTLLGVPLGWVFWRWGLPYAILCHGAANATHRALGSVVF